MVKKLISIWIPVSAVFLALLSGCGGGQFDVVALPKGLVYSQSSVVYAQGVAIEPNMPVSSGGAITQYSVVPALPAGLSLNTQTGVISGTPTAVAAPATYTVTGSNSAGSVTARVEIT
ncbi:hypothetical protein DFQ30_004908, partial [Apophysomyces sp. BC1015]